MLKRRSTITNNGVYAVQQHDILMSSLFFRQLVADNPEGLLLGRRTKKSIALQGKRNTFHITGNHC